MAEANEPPIEAARRELREELGLDLDAGGLLSVEWVPPRGPWDDTLVFIFDGGVLLAATIDGLTITDDEISDFRFCSSDEARELLRPYVWQRAVAALTAIETGRGFTATGTTSRADRATPTRKLSDQRVDAALDSSRIGAISRARET